MSDHASSAPRGLGIGRALGILLLLLIVALVGSYFYSIEARRAGDDAIDRAGLYKRTIVTDYKRFYECMRSGGSEIASAERTKESGGATQEVGGATGAARVAGPAGAYSAVATPPAGGVAPKPAVEASADSPADASGAAGGEMAAHNGSADSTGQGASAGGDNAPQAGPVVYPPYPDYPAFPQQADQFAARRDGVPTELPPGNYQGSQERGGPYSRLPGNGTFAGDGQGAQYSQPHARFAPPNAGRPAGGAQMSPGMHPPQALSQQSGSGLQAATGEQSAPAMSAQEAGPAGGNALYPYPAQMAGSPPYGTRVGPPPSQEPRPQFDNRAYAYPSYGGYPYYRQRAPGGYSAPAYPEHPAASLPSPETAMWPGTAMQPRMPPPQGQSAQEMPPWLWQGAQQQWQQGAAPWQGMRPGPDTQAPWQGMRRESGARAPWQSSQANGAMEPGAAAQALQRRSAADGRLPDGPGPRYAQRGSWQGQGQGAYEGERQNLTPGAPPIVRYDQLAASAPPPGVPVMQGAASARQDSPPGQSSGEIAGGGAAPQYGAPPRQQQAPSGPPTTYGAPETVPYAQAFDPMRPPLWNSGAVEAPAAAGGAVGAEMNPLMSSARQAYSSERYQDSINSYRTLIAKGDDSPAVFGELGNVLLAAGRPQEAAQAYYEASSRLIERGQPASAYLMLSHIETYDPLLGAILNRRLASLPRSLN